MGIWLDLTVREHEAEGIQFLTEKCFSGPKGGLATWAKHFLVCRDTLVDSSPVEELLSQWWLTEESHHG